MLQPLAILINTPSSSSSSSSSSETQTSHHSWNVPAPQSASPVYTRRDDVGDGYSDWLVAKMWVRVAHVHYHILGSLVTSRLLAETVSLAAYRCLPSAHPVSLASPRLVHSLVFVARKTRIYLSLCLSLSLSFCLCLFSDYSLMLRTP